MMDLLSTFREGVTELVRTSLPEPQASLLLGMVMGVKSGFPPGFYENLRITGTLHVVVVSGFNITIIISTLARLLIFIPLKLRLFITLTFITAFVLLVGPEPPVVRAALMGSIALIGTVLGRQRDALRVLLLATVVMLIFERSWATSLSFQLSFLATLGLIVIFPTLDRVVPWRGATLREDLLTTSSAQIAVWPLIAWHFGQVSIISLIVNTLVLWSVPIITYLGLVTVTVGIAINSIAVVILTFPRLFLDYFIWIVNLFSSMNVGYFEISSFSWIALLFYFAALGGGLWFLSQTSHKKRATA